MNPDYYTPPSNQYTSRQPGPQVRTLYGMLLAFIIVLCLWFLFMLFFGYGTLTIKNPANAVTYVNGHKLSTNEVRLRTGHYTITTRTPQYETSQSVISVHLWPTTYSPELKKRNPDAILSSTIGTTGTYGAETLGDIKWFANDTWLVGSVGTGGAAPIALHYQKGDWSVGYYKATGFPQTLEDLPTDVATYTQVIEVKYAN